MITEFKELCIICNRPATEVHHLIYGQGMRAKADADGITAPVCRECHADIHAGDPAAHLSRIIGQLAWERWYLTDYGDAERLDKEARAEFMRRYGISYL